MPFLLVVLTIKTSTRCGSGGLQFFVCEKCHVIIKSVFLCCTTNILVLKIQCKHLPKNDVITKSDPLVAIYAKNNSNGFSLVGKTEWQQNNHDPIFDRRITLHMTDSPDFVKTFMKGCDLVLHVYDVDGAGQIQPNALLGVCTSNTNDILATGT